ncbi:hypothetical protein J6TS2_22430 [Heyndrickxia sporothermodurans]|nr:hypothetical protein J6TS2_22430 [Heyndrickxia sporothermodurans]
MKKNTIIYSILTFIHIGLISVTFVKKRKKQPWLLFFTSVGMAYLFEYIVLNILRGYQYFPRVFKNRRIDSSLGAIVSQAFTVPAAATFIALFRLGKWWSIGFTIFYAITEKLFIRLKLFKNNWWKTGYTLTCLPFYFWLVRKWTEYLEQKKYKWINYGTLFFTLWVNLTNVNFILEGIFKKFIFQKKRGRRKYYQNFVIGPIVGGIKSSVAFLSTIMNAPVIGFGLLHLLDRLLYKYKWIRTNSWSVYYFLPFNLGLLVAGRFFNKQLSKIESDKMIGRGMQ